MSADEDLQYNATDAKQKEISLTGCEGTCLCVLSLVEHKGLVITVGALRTNDNRNEVGGTCKKARYA
jgi:hypothetical protein